MRNWFGCRRRIVPSVSAIFRLGATSIAGGPDACPRPGCRPGGPVGLFDFADRPRLYVLGGSLRVTCRLDPVQFRAVVGSADGG